ncbi:HNH endonuclease [Pseudomonas sp. CCNWLW23]|uniref:HNH endonuclease n=1 Tax=Pseudomonas sp. CCNWLW23 TaxID=3126385 RepID=UPI003012E24B
MTPTLMNFSRAYSFIDNVVSIVMNPSLLGGEDVVRDFFDFKSASFFNQISRPQKHTILHSFIFNVNNFEAQHYLNKVDGETIISDYSQIFSGADIIPPTWFNAEEVTSHIHQLRSIISKATTIITESSFQILFADRTFLFEFNKLISSCIKSLEPQDHDCILKPGVIERPYIPAWLRAAIYHRDKGRCQICGLDMTNYFVPINQRHLDHMVPLKSSGINDPTNFQLLCHDCNSKKGAKIYATKHLTFPYWT